VHLNERMELKAGLVLSDPVLVITNCYLIDRQTDIYIHHQCAVAHIYVRDFQFQLGAVAIISQLGKLKKKRGCRGISMRACMTQRANHYIPAKSNRLRPWCQYSPTYCAPMPYHCYTKFNRGGRFSLSKAGRGNRLRRKLTVNP
jgi:hypothetical protein